MKKIFVILSTITLLCLAIFTLFSCKEEPETSDDQPAVSVLMAKGFTMDGNVGTLIVSNDTEVYSFINQISVQENASWSISTDLAGKDIIVTKTIPLEIGDNTVYLLVSSCDGKEINLYTMTIRRRPMYTVSFQTYGGSYVQSQQVEESFLAIEPTKEVEKDGYDFIKWNYDFTKQIMEDTIVSAVWEAHENTPYKVEYYLQNLEDNNYTLTETYSFTGTTDSTATAEIKSFSHFSFNQQKSTVSAKITGKGNQILKVYYTRDVYSVSISAGPCATITNTINDNYKYGSSINGSIATFNDFYPGYEDWGGWYLNGELYTKNDRLDEFIVDDSVEFVAQRPVKPEMSNFYFGLHGDVCQIEGIKDKSVKEIIIPEYVNRITQGALEGCSSLQSLITPFIGECKYSYYPLGYMFGTSNYNGAVETYQTYNYDNNKTYKFFIPSTLKSISITGEYIPSGAFSNCGMLTNIYLNNVSSIGKNAFLGCNNLHYNEYADAYYLGNETHPYLVFMTTKEEDITSIVFAESTQVIYQNAFYNCSNLTSIVIPDGVKSICNNAFTGCDNLESIIIPDTVKMDIGNNEFFNYKNLKTITIPETVTSIGESAFRGCSKLTNVTIPDSVTTIGTDAFAYCYNLSHVTIGKSVSRIGSCAFYECNKLVEVYNKSSLRINYGDYSINGYIACYAKNIYKDENGSKLSTTNDDYILYVDNEDVMLIMYIGSDSELVLPNSITQIYQYAFNNDATTTSITIPDNMTSIGYGAFSYCSRLANITIPNSVTSIGDFAFCGCKDLTSINIPNSVTSIGNGAFSGCSALANIAIPNSVTSIGENAFYGCEIVTATIPTIAISYIINAKLETVTISSGIIGKWAFYNFSGLTSVTIGNDVWSIEDDAFCGCSGLTSVTIGNNVTSIGYAAFSGCSSLTNIIIPNGVISIGDYAFSDCSSLTSVAIGYNVTSIGDHAFFNCNIINATIPTMAISLIKNDKLESVTITRGQIIEDYAFSGCNALTEITIPNSVIKIGYRAFYNCSSLTSITIPNSVTSIGYNAFYGCNQVTSVIFDNTNGWYVSTSSTATSGTDISLTDVETNATYLKSTYTDYYWKRREI